MFKWSNLPSVSDIFGEVIETPLTYYLISGVLNEPSYTQNII